MGCETLARRWGPRNDRWGAGDRGGGSDEGLQDRDSGERWDQPDAAAGGGVWAAGAERRGEEHVRTAGAGADEADVGVGAGVWDRRGAPAGRREAADRVPAADGICDAGPAGERGGVLHGAAEG